VLTIESYLYGGTPIPYERNIVMADAAAGMEVPVSPGEMQINADVSVVYGIE
jgi:uncharacterized protein YggE